MGALDGNAFGSRNGAGNLQEINELKRTMSQLEQAGKELIFKIGALYAEQNDLNSVAGTEFEPLLQQLGQIKKETTVLNKRILALQGLRRCEKCDNILSLESAFCNKCGEKLNALFTEEEVGKNMCKNCGAHLDEGAAFCTFCGKKISESKA